MSDKTHYNLRIDPDSCVGHGRCYAVAPALFAPDDDEGHARVLVELIADAQLELAQLAVNSCPEAAITLEK